MEIFHRISGSKNGCSLLKFGNRSWLGTPFSTPNYCYTSGSVRRVKNRKKKDDTFDFGEKWRVI